MVWPGVLLRLLRLWDFERGREGAAKASILDRGQIAGEDRFVSVLPMQDRQAKRRAGPAEEVEARFVVVLPTEPVDLVRDGEHAELIGIVARQRKTQEGKVPCAQ